jgi:hypothetical protein
MRPLISEPCWSHPLHVFDCALQRFAFNLDQCITLISEAEFGEQTRSAIKVIQYERETL